MLGGVKLTTGHLLPVDQRHSILVDKGKSMSSLGPDADHRRVSLCRYEVLLDILLRRRLEELRAGKARNRANLTSGWDVILTRGFAR